MMKKSPRKVVTAALSLALAAGMTVTQASAVYYSNSFAFDSSGLSFAIPEAYRFYSVINRFDGGIGTFSAPTDICFDEAGLLYVVDKDNQRVLIMDGDGKVQAILGSSMPDGSVEEEAESGEESGESEEVEEPEESEEPEEGESQGESEIVDMITAVGVRDSRLERTDLTVEVANLEALDMVLSRAYAERFLSGEYSDGKSVENLTVVISEDIDVATLADAGNFETVRYRYRYSYKDTGDGNAEKQETLSMNVTLQVAEGVSLTVGVPLDMGVLSIVNKGVVEVMPNGKLDLSGCTFSNDGGQLIQHYMGAIVNTAASESVEPSIPEGTRATYVIDEDYSVQFVYLYLKNPEGVCASYGNIYICDTENHRVVIMASDYSDMTEYTEEMVREEAIILGSTYNFTPSKIGVSNTGMMYILNKSSYKGFFTMNKDGDFCGFVGATKVTSSVTEVLVQIFGTAAQKSKIENKQPAPASNLYVVDNMVYSTVVPSSTEPDPKRITKINVVGSDLFPDGDYVISSYSTEEQENIETNYVDICVDEYGIVTVLDNELGYIMQLNQLGDIIAVFGGKSNRQGQFLLPTAMDINPTNHRIYVADSLKGSIQVFEPTKFINLVHEASAMYYEGLYSESVSLWEEVASIDETYDLAHVGIAESIYGDGYNLQAMEKFEYAWNYEGYDKAFSDFRLSLFRYYFAPIVLSIFALIVLIAYGFIALKRRSDNLYK